VAKLRLWVQNVQDVQAVQIVFSGLTGLNDWNGLNLLNKSRNFEEAKQKQIEEEADRERAP
jgi:hypothetical protein